MSMPLYILLLLGIGVAIAEDRIRIGQILAKVSNLIRKQVNLTALPLSVPSPSLNHLSLKGDMRLSEKQAQRMLDLLQGNGALNIDGEGAGSAPGEDIWNLPIKYTFDSNFFYETEKEVIRKGLKLWEKETCVRFEEHASKREIDSHSSILFMRDDGCYSSVGCVSHSTQNISLAVGCIYVGTVAHEVGHALGFYHEQERPDRDRYIRILWSNVIPGDEYNFAVTDSQTLYDSPYDYSSIMHYDSMAFSKARDCKKRTIETYDPHYMATIGQDQRLSFYDSKRINLHYNCIATSCRGVRLNETCQNGGYQDPNNCTKCKCPEGYGGDFCEMNEPSRQQVSCGGTIYLEACSSATISSPNHPLPYPPGSSCSWVIKAPRGSGLVFGFEDRPRLPYYTGSCTCVDYVEIRTSRDQSSPGPRFCGCGVTSGRVAFANRNRAVVVFRSFDDDDESAETATGFRLVAYATCRGVTATDLTQECLITKSGYCYGGRRSMPSNNSEDKSCVPWVGQPSFGDWQFPFGDMRASASYCRNPDSSDSPWCYVNSDYKHKSIADCKSIPRCPISTDGIAPPTPDMFSSKAISAKKNFATPTTSKGDLMMMCTFASLGVHWLY